MSALFPGLVPAPTGEPITPAHADRLREIEVLTDEDKNLVTKDHARIVDLVRRADGLPHWADLMIEDKPGSPWLGLMIVASATFWAALGLILLT